MNTTTNRQRLIDDIRHWLSWYDAEPGMGESIAGLIALVRELAATNDD